MGLDGIAKARAMSLFDGYGPSYWSVQKTNDFAMSFSTRHVISSDFLALTMVLCTAAAAATSPSSVSSTVSVGDAVKAKWELDGSRVGEKRMME